MVDIPNDPVIEAVRADLLRRQQHGYLKYGGILSENPAGLKGALQHAYEEALDLCNYLKWSIMVLNRDPMIRPVADHNTGLMKSRRRCESSVTNAHGTCVVCFAEKGQPCLSPAADPLYGSNPAAPALAEAKRDNKKKSGLTPDVVPIETIPDSLRRELKK